MEKAVEAQPISNCSALTPEEREEFDRLYREANAEAERQYVVLVHPEMIGQPLRPILNALRDGSWRKKISYGTH